MKNQSNEEKLEEIVEKLEELSDSLDEMKDGNDADMIDADMIAQETVCQLGKWLAFFADEPGHPHHMPPPEPQDGRPTEGHCPPMPPHPDFPPQPHGPMGHCHRPHIMRVMDKDKNSVRNTFGCYAVKHNKNHDNFDVRVQDWDGHWIDMGSYATREEAQASVKRLSDAYEQGLDYFEI